MATNFPTSLDSLTNPTASDKLNSVTVPHASQHADINDAVEALEAKVGVNGSAVTTSHDYLIDKQSVVPYDDASARTTAVPSPVEGQMSYLKDTNSVEVYDGSAWVGVGGTGTDFTVEYLVIGGGAGGANDAGVRGAGGGGAGGYRNSYASETSGRGSSTEATLTVNTAYDLIVTVGAGGAGGPASGYQNGANGNESRFYLIMSDGGGGGKANSGAGKAGAAGGGGTHSVNYTNGGSGCVNQGYDGGGGFADGVRFGGGGGGGAGAVGGNASVSGGGNGGNGLSSSINGSAVTRGGGGGGVDGNISVGGSGGTGGGGDGDALAGGAGEAGTANTGGGGGAGDAGGGGNGGSGVILVRYPTSQGLPTIGAGLTYLTGTDGTDTIITFTAGSDTITWS